MATLKALGPAAAGAFGDVEAEHRLEFAKGLSRDGPGVSRMDPDQSVPRAAELFFRLGQVDPLIGKFRRTFGQPADAALAFV